MRKHTHFDSCSDTCDTEAVAWKNFTGTLAGTHHSSTRQRRSWEEQAHFPPKRE